MSNAQVSSAEPQPDFVALPVDVQAAVRERQLQRKQEKKAGKLAKQREKLKQGATFLGATPVGADFPDIISKDEYFDACPGGLFRDPSLPPTEHSLDLLLNALDRHPPLGTCSYFQFSGSAEELWNPTFNARLAFEGFFTITAPIGPGQTLEPLPELQPFYGVLTWPNFEASKHVQAALRRLKKPGSRKYKLVVCKDPCRTWKLLNEYHERMHGTNWLTKRYFDMSRAASADASINFRFHCVELYEDESEESSVSSSTPDKLSSLPVAGEIGFSIGKVYTSLSGWTAERTAENFGTAQLVLLGRLLQKKGYEFWSLGHCYSPQMEYKRQLGHRIYPRADFLEFLKKHRGDFRPGTSASAEADKFETLGEGTSIAATELATKD